MVAEGTLRRIGLISAVALAGCLVLLLIADRAHNLQRARRYKVDLLNLHKAWAADGRPADRDIARHFRSTIQAHFTPETNHFLVDGQLVEALFGVQYDDSRKRVSLIVTTDGQLFEQRGGRLVRSK